jgi:hypothetical protein
MQTKVRESATGTVQAEPKAARRRSRRRVLAALGAVAVAGSVAVGLLADDGGSPSPTTGKSEVPTPIVTVPGGTGQEVSSLDG